MLREHPELRTSGPYRIIRHPIYTGILGMLLGSAMLLGSVMTLSALIVAVSVFLVRHELVAHPLHLGPPAVSGLQAVPPTRRDAAAARPRASASSAAATAKGDSRRAAATRTSWPSLALTRAAPHATSTAGNMGRPAPRASTAPAAPAETSRPTSPAGSSREGVVGRLSATSSSATPSHANGGAGPRVSSRGRPPTLALIKAATATVERSPVAAPASAARRRCVVTRAPTTA